MRNIIAARIAASNLRIKNHQNVISDLQDEIGRESIIVGELESILSEDKANQTRRNAAADDILQFARELTVTHSSKPIEAIKQIRSMFGSTLVDSKRAWEKAVAEI